MAQEREVGMHPPPFEHFLPEAGPSRTRSSQNASPPLRDRAIDGWARGGCSCGGGGRGEELKPAPSTLHLAHPAPYTLHPTPCSSSPAP